MTSQAAHVFTRRVEFADTDAAGIAHFARLLTMIEEAEHDFFRKHQIPILAPESAWPCISLHTDFRSKCHFGDILTINLRVMTVGRSSFNYFFAVFKQEGDQKTEVFRGEMTKCHVDPGTNNSSPIPDSAREILEKAAH
jgi:YbgC/YbaW family acyl-CoA thioester hydrolase